VPTEVILSGERLGAEVAGKGSKLFWLALPLFPYLYVVTVVVAVPAAARAQPPLGAPGPSSTKTTKSGEIFNATEDIRTGPAPLRNKFYHPYLLLAKVETQMPRSRRGAAQTVSRGSAASCSRRAVLLRGPSRLETKVKKANLA
jgi:hypothetical protein